MNNFSLEMCTLLTFVVNYNITTLLKDVQKAFNELYESASMNQVILQSFWSSCLLFIYAYAWIYCALRYQSINEVVFYHLFLYYVFH